MNEIPMVTVGVRYKIIALDMFHEHANHHSRCHDNHVLKPSDLLNLTNKKCTMVCVRWEYAWQYELSIKIQQSQNPTFGIIFKPAAVTHAVPVLSPIPYPILLTHCSDVTRKRSQRTWLWRMWHLCVGMFIHAIKVEFRLVCVNHWFTHIRHYSELNE